MSVPALGTLLRSTVRRYLDSQLLSLESLVPDEHDNHTPHGAEYGIVKAGLGGSAILYVLAIFVLFGLCLLGHVFDRKILMDKYPGLGLNNSMTDLMRAVLPDIALLCVSPAYLALCDRSPVGLFLLLG